MIDAASFVLIAGIMSALVMVELASKRIAFGEVNVHTFAAAIIFGAPISLSLALAISSILEPYSQYARDLRTWIDHWAEHCHQWSTDVIWDLQTVTAYWLTYGLWAARYFVWNTRLFLRR